ncbi:MAG: nucleotide exchange factor GrpE [Thermoguttaceae bacterium]|nr:nucleotide exchange factor GrpE [Thermoguttaceae bacterium]
MNSYPIHGNPNSELRGQNVPSEPTDKPMNAPSAAGPPARSGQGCSTEVGPPAGAMAAPCAKDATQQISSEAQAAVSAAEAADLAEQLQQLRSQLTAAQEACQRAEAELAEANEAKLRALAELENFRRRVQRQLEEERRYALFPLVRDLLPVLDNLRRAVDSGQKSQDAAGLLAGVQLVYKQLQDVLQRHQCVEIEALGATFDPNLHQAVSQVPSPEHPPGAILEVVQPGFRLHDRVVRPSLVVVATAPPGTKEPEAEKADHPPSPDATTPPTIQTPPSDDSSGTNGKK